MANEYKAGDKIQLAKQEVEVEQCRECSKLMVNLDADQLAPGDLTLLKNSGVRISNPDTDKAVCISCEYQTFGRKVADFFEDEEDDDDDSSLFSGGVFGGSHLGGGGFGGFGGFGGGGFGGGGASRGF